MHLIGTPNRLFNVFIVDALGANHAGQSNVSFASDSTATINPVLSPGYNSVCITLMGGTQGSIEATQCIDVAYLP